NTVLNRNCVLKLNCYSPAQPQLTPVAQPLVELFEKNGLLLTIFAWGLTDCPIIKSISSISDCSCNSALRYSILIVSTSKASLYLLMSFRFVPTSARYSPQRQ